MAKTDISAPVVVKIALAIPLYHFFDYLYPETELNKPLEKGMRVIVPFGRMQKTGFVVEVAQFSELTSQRLKPIISVLDCEPVFDSVEYAFLTWASQYYHYPLGEVFNAAIPLPLRQGKSLEPEWEKAYQLSAQGSLLTPAQLKKTPKQKQLFEVLAAHDSPVTAKKLAQINPNWRPLIQSLMKKKLVERVPSTLFIEKTGLSEQILEPNLEQKNAIKGIIKAINQFSVFLLDGVTGSGKTEVYLQVIDQVIKTGGQVLVLLPEISLTPQLERRFNKRFTSRLCVSHSKMSATQRHKAWWEMRQGHAKILLGTRSAIFTPMKEPGLIIVDEEHDTSFKQQDGFRFSARDLAVVRAKVFGIPLILGSATPSLESFQNTLKNRYQHFRLTQRAGGAEPPVLKILDIRNQKLLSGLSPRLLGSIQQTLKREEQVLLFLNRRGYAPVLMCHACGWVARCQACETSLVIHQESKQLVCHHCGYQQRLISICPACKSSELHDLGIGTEKVEVVLKQQFSEACVIRIDRDTTKNKGQLENYLEQISTGACDIILGTQMLAKGHHFENVTLVAIIDVDSGLFSLDYHAFEKLAQLIVQVAGRAGRAEKKGRVILQTRQPEHPLLTMLIKQGYSAFAESALDERSEAGLPPFTFQALLRAQSKRELESVNFLIRVTEMISDLGDDGLLCFGPVSAPMKKKAGHYCFQVMLQHNRRKCLQKALGRLIPAIYELKYSAKVNWSLDVDPVDLF